MAYFGPSGNEERFYELGYKSSLQMPEYVRSLDLDAYEYQCSRGVKITQKTANALGDEAKKYNVRLSIHSPYYILLFTLPFEYVYTIHSISLNNSLYSREKS